MHARARVGRACPARCLRRAVMQRHGKTPPPPTCAHTHANASPDDNKSPSFVPLLAARKEQQMNSINLFVDLLDTSTSPPTPIHIIYIYCQFVYNRCARRAGACVCVCACRVGSGRRREDHACVHLSAKHPAKHACSALLHTRAFQGPGHARVRAHTHTHTHTHTRTHARGTRAHPPHTHAARCCSARRSRTWSSTRACSTRS